MGAIATVRRSGSGLLAALRLSDADELRARSGDCWSASDCPTRLDGSVDVGAVMRAVGRDKKRTPEGVAFVLRPSRAARTGQIVDPDRVRAP